MLKPKKSSLAMKTTDQIILFKSILENTTQYAIFAIDLSHKILIWNEGARHLYGYLTQEILHKNSHILYDQADIDSGKVNGIFDVVLRKGTWSGELKGITKTEKQFNALVNISLCKNLKGKIIGYTLITRDLTELQNVLQIMSKLKESEKILHIKNEELNVKIQEAKAANRLKNEFVANMSHELRTPLNGIIGFSQMLMKEKAGELTLKQKEYLAIVLTSAHQLLYLINDLLDHAKISAGKMEFNPEKIDLNNFTQDISEFFKSHLLKKNLQLTIEIDQSLQNIIIDSVKLKQIFNNYISNAIKFTPDGGKITITVNQDQNNNFCIAVQDTGIGIHKKDIKRLFTEFQQLSTGKDKKFPGTGLGLALTRQLVELQGGKVGVTSNYGEGSTFYATLPTSPLETKNSLIKSEAKKKPPKPRILVIENQSQQRNVLLESLSNAGFSAESADDLNEVLKDSRSLKVDAIILDFFLSDIHNWRILQASHFKKNHIPVLVLVIALEAGNFGFRIQDFLIKPIVPENIISALESAGAGPHKNKSILIVDDDKRIINMTKKILPKYGYTVICKSNKKNALSIAKKQNIDVVIVNILMSGIEGLDFLMQYQRTKPNKNIPIIIWRPEQIDDAELNHLKTLFQQIVLKDENVSKSLLSEFEGNFPLLNSKWEHLS